MEAAKCADPLIADDDDEDGDIRFLRCFCVFEVVDAADTDADALWYGEEGDDGRNEVIDGMEPFENAECGPWPKEMDPDRENEATPCCAVRAELDDDDCPDRE